MTIEELKEIFEDNNTEFLKFDKIENKLSTRPDLHAFLLLDKLFPGSSRDMVSGAEHDEIFLEPDLDELAAIVTKSQFIELIRCGVRFGEYNNLAMFV